MKYFQQIFNPKGEIFEIFTICFIDIFVVHGCQQLFSSDFNFHARKYTHSTEYIFSVANTKGSSGAWISLAPKYLPKILQIYQNICKAKYIKCIKISAKQSTPNYSKISQKVHQMIQILWRRKKLSKYLKKKKVHQIIQAFPQLHCPIAQY